METTVMDNPKPNKFMSAMRKVNQALHNQTFLYIVKRILSSLLTLFLLIVLIIALIRILPDDKFYNQGDYRLIQAKGTKEIADRWLQMQLFRYGILDINGHRVSVFTSIFTYIYQILPIYKEIPIRWSTDYTQVLDYWKGFSYFGRSLVVQNKDVLELFTERMGISFVISIITVSLTYVFAVPLGVAMAKKPGGFTDKLGNIFIVLNYSIPAIVFYLIMNMVFGKKDGIFGWADFGFFYDDESPFLTLVPPISCMVFLSIPGVSIWIRRFMLDELSNDYVKFARSKGLSERTIMYKHVFRNAIVPLVRNVPATILGAIVGSYYIETIWKIPGTGRLLVTGLQSTPPDISIIEGLTLIYGAISMLSFLLGDIVTVFFDPRIKLED